MKEVVLAGGGPTVSRFIFGASTLLSAGVRSARLRLLQAAVDQGFTHFDTSPYYGFGVSERDLGEALAGRPQLGVTTKVGLYPPGGFAHPELLALLTKGAGRLAPAISRPRVDWSVAHARRSLRDSLKRLRRDQVALYLLHEPQADVIGAEEWLRWLEDERAAGHVGRFGLAGDATRLASFVTRGSPLADLLQTGDSIEGREADKLTVLGRPPQITFGYIAAALKHGRFDFAQVLAGATARNPHGAVVVSTRRVARLAQWAAAS